jgi:hypothetical protein
MRWHFPASDCFFAPLSLRQRKWKEELMVPIARTKPFDSSQGKHRALIFLILLFLSVPVYTFPHAKE